MWISGIYETENGAKLEVVEIDSGVLDATFSGAYEEEGFYFMGAVLDYKNDTADFVEEVFGETNKINMKTSGDVIIVDAMSTEKDSIYQNINGIYKFVEEKVWNFEDCKQQAEEIYVDNDCFMY